MSLLVTVPHLTGDRAGSGQFRAFDQLPDSSLPMRLLSWWLILVAGLFVQFFLFVCGTFGGELDKLIAVYREEMFEIFKGILKENKKIHCNSSVVKAAEVGVRVDKEASRAESRSFQLPVTQSRSGLLSGPLRPTVEREGLWPLTHEHFPVMVLSQDCLQAPRGQD